MIWFGAAVVGIGIGTRGNPPVTLFVVAYFFTIETVAAFLLFRAARHRVGYARTRLRIASAATVCFAVAILVSGAGAAAAAGGAATDPGITAIARVLALVAGLGYLAAFIPPVALRRLQQRAVAFDLGQSFLGAPVDGDPDALWVALAHAARTITNGPAAVIALGTPPAVRIVDGTPPTPQQVGAPYDGPTLSDGKDAAGEATISLPIESDLGRQGWLVVHPDAGSLFLDDDRVLLSLLAGQAARAAERREAIRQQGVLESELEDASHELEFSRAQLESEARFRAALEAHPGILLVIEPDGRVGYANGQALRSLGYSADEIRGLSLDDLLVRPPTGRPSDVGSGEARRRDGTTIPVDFAVSTFESRGELSSIAVLIDITDRLENDHLRDTFIGILSHELRTPVTAIYGGSQVLLGRGERLDPAVSRELITDIAAESERLHRLIENLLVLARVERGEELIGGEPVLLQRVLPTIVEREREIWLGTTISAVVAPGLPTVRGHDGYVSQVIRNLLSNAVKYGGPTANVEIVADGRYRRRDRPRPRRRPGARRGGRGSAVRPLLPGARRGRRGPGRRDRLVRLPPDRDQPRRDDLGEVASRGRCGIRVQPADLRGRRGPRAGPSRWQRRGARGGVLVRGSGFARLRLQAARHAAAPLVSREWHLTGRTVASLPS